MWNPFLKTNQAEHIFILDYYGYHIVDNQSELTIPQELFLLMGKPKFDKKIADEQERRMKRNG